MRRGSTSGRGRLAVAGGAAGVLMALGSILDWSGVSYSSALDRSLAFAAGAASIAAAIFGRRRRWALAALVPLGALAANMAIVNYRDIDRRAYEYAAYPDAAVGIGIYVLGSGAAIAIATGVAAALTAETRARGRRPGAPAAPPE